MDKETLVRVCWSFILVTIRGQSDGRVATEGGLMQFDGRVEQGDVRVEGYEMGGYLVTGLARATTASK